MEALHSETADDHRDEELQSHRGRTRASAHCGGADIPRSFWLLLLLWIDFLFRFSALSVRHSFYLAALC